MAIAELAIIIGTSLLDSVLAVAADSLLAPILQPAREKLERFLKQNKYEAIDRALNGAAQDVIEARSAKSEAALARDITSTLLEAKTGPILREFGLQITNSYIVANPTEVSAIPLAKDFRKLKGTVEIVKGNVADEASIIIVLDDFLRGFRERLLSEEGFSYLREYDQLTEARKQTKLQNQMANHLKTIVDNTATVSDDFVRIRESYLADLVREYKDLKIRGFSPLVSSRVLSLPINEVFLPLQAEEGRPAIAQYADEDLRKQATFEALTELGWRQQREDMEKRYAQLRSQQLTKRTLKLVDLLKSTRSVLLGDPGAGKTTVTRYITYALATGDDRHIGKGMTGLIPVLIRVANYGKAFESDNTLHLVEYIEKELQSKPEYGRFLKHALSHGQCLVILDGLDEVTNPSLRMSVTDEIISLVAGYSDNHYIVTSRIVGYEVSPLTQEFKHATLKELSPEDRAHFISLWYDAIRQETSDGAVSGSAQDLTTALGERPQIAKMAANPLLLTIIVLMHWRGVKLPNRRVQVYQIATDTLIEYWTKQRDIDLDAEDVKSVLAPIAHYILSSNVGGVIAHNDLLPRFFEGVRKQRGCDMNEARRIGRELLQDLNEQSGLFLERGRDTNDQPVYGFLHQTFGEYLAALHLSQLMLEDEFKLEDYIHRSAWYEPMLLMVGDLSLRSPSHANKLIRQILSFPALYEDVLERNLLLAADCLGDDVQLHVELRKEILDRLAKLLTHPSSQLRTAAERGIKSLAATRHREAATQTLRAIYELDQPDAQVKKLSYDRQIVIASALVALGEPGLAQPIVWALETSEQVHDVRIQRVRFEGWPHQAMEYVLAKQKGKKTSFNIIARDRLEVCQLGFVNTSTMRRVLGEPQCLQLIQELAQTSTSNEDRVALRWIAALINGDTNASIFRDFLDEEHPAAIRRMAAERLLDTPDRPLAVHTLRKLVESSADEATTAAQALLSDGEPLTLNRQLLAEIALLSSDTYEGSMKSEAISALLQTGEVSLAVPLAIQMLLNTQLGYSSGYYKIKTARSLIEHGFERLGVDAARRLCLQPGSSSRLLACSLLLEHGFSQDVVSCLRYLVYETHNADSHAAIEQMLFLREAEHCASVLAASVTSPVAETRYRACLTLALTNSYIDGTISIANRTQLKQSIQDERTKLYEDAGQHLRQSSLEALNSLHASDTPALSHPAQKLARLALTRRLDTSPASDSDELFDILITDPSPAIKLSSIGLARKPEQILQGQSQLATILEQDDVSEPVLIATLHWHSCYTISNLDRVTRFLLGNTPQIRSSAARALGSLGDSAAVPLLVAALSDDDSNVRSSAANALGSLGDSAAVPLLVAALSDDDSNVRSSAANALGSLGDSAAVPLLVAALSDDDSSVRSSAADALGSLGDSAAVPLLVAALSDDDSSVRSSAADALGSLGDSAAVPLLVAALSDDDSNVRSSAANALGSLGDSAAVPLLVAALSDDDSSVRWSAARALGSLGDSAAVPLLVAALSDDDSNVRWSAARALGSLGDSAAVPLLVAALSDDDSNVRWSAARALGSLGDSAAVPLLVAALSDDDSNVRSSAANALGSLGDSAAVPLLVAALSDDDSSVRSSAADALGSLGDSAAVPLLVAALSDDDSNVRSSAANALGSLGDSAAVPLLVAALSDDDSSVRWSAARALGSLGDSAAVPLLVAALSDDDSNVRWSAATSLIKLDHIGMNTVTGMWNPRFICDGGALLAALINTQPTIALRAIESILQRSKSTRLDDALQIARAQALWNLGREEEALQAAQIAIASGDKKSSMRILCLAHFWIERGDYASAGQQIESALRRKPKAALCWLSQAVVLWRTGQQTQAIESLRKATKLYRAVADRHDLRWDRHWRHNALSALGEMLALK